MISCRSISGDHASIFYRYRCDDVRFTALRLYQPNKGNRTAKARFGSHLSPWSLAPHYHDKRLDGLPVPKVVADEISVAHLQKWVLGFFSLPTTAGAAPTKDGNS